MDDQLGKASPGRIAAVAALVMAGCLSARAPAPGCVSRRRRGAALPALRRRDRDAPPDASAAVVDRPAQQPPGKLPAPPAGRGQHRVRRRGGGRQPRPRADRGHRGPPLRRRLRSAGDDAPRWSRTWSLRCSSGRWWPRWEARGSLTAGGVTGGFWIVWQEWWLSNAITGLTLLVLLTIDLRRLTHGWRVPGRRAVEAFALRVGPDRRQRAGVRAHVRPDRPHTRRTSTGRRRSCSGARSASAPARPAPPCSVSRSAVDLGGDQRARAVLAQITDREPPRAAAVLAGWNRSPRCCWRR